VDKVKLGFIGVGGIAGAHLNILTKMEDVEVKSICDINPQTLERRGQEFGVEARYENFKEMIEKEDLDAVYICVPPFAHADIEETVAESGVHMFIEKPVELHMESAIRKEEVIRKSGVIVSVGYCARYLDISDRVKELLKDKVVELALGYFMGGAPGGWWRQKDKSGGQLVEQTTHMVDIARFFVGDVQAVNGAFVALTKPSPDYTIDNASIVTLYFKSGAIGSITSACMLSQGYKTGLDMFARDYILEFTYGNLRIRTPQGIEEIKAGVNMYYEENRAFIDAVKSGDRSLIRSPYADAVKTLEVTLAAEVSAKERKVVEMKFE
jgi:predicted dehydrogenase